MTTTTQTEAALVAEGLRIRAIGGSEILHGVSFTLQPGKILALVGESGSGKTTAGLACMGHFRAGLENTGGTVRIADGAHTSGTDDMLALPETARRGLRGGTVSYVPQDPALSLNPAMRIGEQILETLQVHGYGANERERRERTTEVLAEVGLANDRAYQRRYPHQLSGGQQQRVGIAMAFACLPAVMVLDEPTTGLDVTTQALVLQTIHEMAARHDVAGLYITHDLAVVATVADEVAVMLKGDLVETGPTEEVLFHPRHRYTKRLLAAVPDLAGKRKVGEVGSITDELSILTGSVPVQPSEPATTETPADAGEGTVSDEAEERPAGSVTEPAEPASDSASAASDAPASVPAAADPVIGVRDLRLAYGESVILDGIDIELSRGESMMLLGESGSGKTTLSRCIAGLNRGYTGRVELEGEELAKGTRDRTTSQRQSIQYVFQSPFSSLNPRRTIAESIEVPLTMSRILPKKQRRAAVLEALDQVRLGADYADRRPGDLSGGERQRAAIARALVNAPSVLVCDEVTSALDVSVQASILDLLRTLQLETGMSMLFVTHNIALARHISQRLAVLQKGRIVDLGLTDDVLENPRHPYTRELLENVPTF